MERFDQYTVLVLASGGMDSTFCLCWAKESFNRVEAISFNYDQKHSAELRAVVRVCQELQIPHVRVPVTIPGVSALVDRSMDVSAQHPLNPSLPATFTPARNAIFLSLAASYAYTKRILNLVIGASQIDYSGYPDCRNYFLDAMRKALQFALDEPHLKIHAPVLYISKAEYLRTAKDKGWLGLIKEAHTCYNNIPGSGCKECPACKLRAQAFLDAFGCKEEDA